MTAMTKLVTLLFVFTLSLNTMAESINGRKVKWLDNDKEVYVLQDKEFTKAGKFVVNIGMIDNLDVAYQKTKGFKGEIDYFLSEYWSIEFFYKSYSNTKNNDLKSLESIVNVKPLVRRPITTMGFGAAWSPLYGKINVFNNIVYFDMGMGLYYTKIEAESNIETFGIATQPLLYDAESFTGFTGKFYFRVYISEIWNVGYEYNITTFTAPVTRTGSEERDYITDMVINFGVMF